MLITNTFISENFKPYHMSLFTQIKVLFNSFFLAPSATRLPIVPVLYKR